MKLDNKYQLDKFKLKRLKYLMVGLFRPLISLIVFYNVSQQIVLVMLLLNKFVIIHGFDLFHGKNFITNKFPLPFALMLQLIILMRNKCLQKVNSLNNFFKILCFYEVMMFKTFFKVTNLIQFKIDNFCDNIILFIFLVIKLQH